MELNHLKVQVFAKLYQVLCQTGRIRPQIPYRMAPVKDPERIQLNSTLRPDPDPQHWLYGQAKCANLEGELIVAKNVVRIEAVEVQ